MIHQGLFEKLKHKSLYEFGYNKNHKIKTGDFMDLYNHWNDFYKTIPKFKKEKSQKSQKSQKHQEFLKEFEGIYYDYDYDSFCSWFWTYYNNKDQKQCLSDFSSLFRTSTYPKLRFWRDVLYKEMLNQNHKDDFFEIYLLEHFMHKLRKSFIPQTGTGSQSFSFESYKILRESLVECIQEYNDDSDFN